MTAYNIYQCLNIMLDNYMDSILLKEDPTEQERKDYDIIKFWRPSEPDDKVISILKNIQIEIGDKGPIGEKGD